MAAHPAAAIEGAPPFRRRSQVVEKLFRTGTAAVSVGLILLLVALLLVLLKGSQRIFSAFGFHFLIGTSWNPVVGHEAFGALPFIYGTLVTSAVAVVLAVPVSVGIALLLNEVHTGWIRDPLATFIDVLAAIPSIVYGLWGLFVLKPFLDRYVEPYLQDTHRQDPRDRAPVLGQSGRTRPLHGGRDPRDHDRADRDRGDA